MHGLVDGTRERGRLIHIAGHGLGCIRLLVIDRSWRPADEEDNDVINVPQRPGRAMAMTQHEETRHDITRPFYKDKITPLRGILQTIYMYTDGV